MDYQSLHHFECFRGLELQLTRRYENDNPHETTLYTSVLVHNFAFHWESHWHWQVSSTLWPQGPMRGGGRRWKTNCIRLWIPSNFSTSDVVIQFSRIRLETTTSELQSTTMHFPQLFRSPNSSQQLFLPPSFLLSFVDLGKDGALFNSNTMMRGSYSTDYLLFQMKLQWRL